MLKYSVTEWGKRSSSFTVYDFQGIAAIQLELNPLCPDPTD